jgi:hypothetical protein
MNVIALCSLAVLALDLTSGLPPALDAYRFSIDKLSTSECRCLNRQVTLALTYQRELRRHLYEEYTEAIADLEWSYRAWDVLDDIIASRSLTVTPDNLNYRRRKLAELREIIGPGLYNKGAMPPPVPLWVLREIP